MAALRAGVVGCGNVAGNHAAAYRDGVDLQSTLAVASREAVISRRRPTPAATAARGFRAPVTLGASDRRLDRYFRGGRRFERGGFELKRSISQPTSSLSGVRGGRWQAVSSQSKWWNAVESNLRGSAGPCY